MMVIAGPTTSLKLVKPYAAAQAPAISCENGKMF